jgi:phosphoribosylanthranilate isomerase
MMMVKVCGMRQPQNIADVEALGIDMMGFIFHPRSPRYVEQRPAYMPKKCRRIGVFVNASTDEILRRVDDFQLNGVQLHGSETPEQCRQLRERGLMVIKAISSTANLDAAAAPYATTDSGCDLLLFDTACATHGGSGRSFDWGLLDTYTGSVPFLLSGGINPQSLAALAALHHPMWRGVDLNSGFEIAPTLKNVDSLRLFINQFRTIKFPQQ